LLERELDPDAMLPGEVNKIRSFEIYSLEMQYTSSGFPSRRNWLENQVRGDQNMSRKLDVKGTASFEEVLISNVYTQEAIINVLVKRGLFTKAETVAEIANLRANAPKRR
jgi:hypothetical protein